jgi:predicted DNA-binding protein
MSEGKRKPGRPSTGQTPTRNIRMPDERWEALDKKSKQAGSDRAKVVNDLAAWYVREDDAELPERPD